MHRHAFLLFTLLILLSRPLFAQSASGPGDTNDTITSCTESSAGHIVQGTACRFVFENWARPGIPVWAWFPTVSDIRNAPVLIVMHGMNRDADRYIPEWQELAEEHGVIVVVPEFSKADFPRSAGYNLGNVFRRQSGEIENESLWSFSAIEPLFDDVVGKLRGHQTMYTIFGHSAGSQFVHRYLYYKPTARVKRFIAANAGWYTLPDPDEQYPYGLRGAATPEGSLRAALGKDVIVLLGTADNNPDHKSLRRTPEAMRQGKHRFDRGQFYYESGRRQAEKLNVPFRWKLVTVNGVAHSNGEMAKAAISYVAP